MTRTELLKLLRDVAREQRLLARKRPIRIDHSNRYLPRRREGGEDG